MGFDGPGLCHSVNHTNYHQSHQLQNEIKQIFVELNSTESSD